MTGQHTLSASVNITRPAYDVSHPAVTLWATGFETGNHSLADAGFTGPSHSRYDSGITALPHSGAWSAHVYTRYAAGVSPMVVTFTKTLTGLVVGRTYTVTCYASQLTDGDPSNRTEQVRLGIAGGTTGTYVTLTTGWKLVSLTFTATATTHGLQLTGNETDTGTFPSSGFFVDDMKVVKDAWVEHFPAVSTVPTVLDVVDASLTLDDSWAPYCQVDLTCWTPPEEVLEFIDPRVVNRVTLTVSDGTVSRAFNLMLRSRSVDHVTGQMAVVAESDEAVLIDLARVAAAPDGSAIAYQASLRTLINTVILAPIGAHLETDNGADADLTVYADQTNLLPNPSAEVNTTGWTATGCTLTRVLSSVVTPPAGSYVFRLASPTGAASYATSAAISVTPGESYVVMGSGRATTPGTGASDSKHGQIIVLADGTSTVLASTPAVPNTNPANAFNFVSASFTVPAGVTAVTVRFFLGYAAGMYDWDAFKLAPATEVLDLTYHDGDTPDTAQYRYDWTGPAHASSSTRTDLTGTGRSVEMFRWLPGITYWDFISPLVEAGGLRLFCDEARRWHLVNPLVYSVPGLVTIAADTNATDALDDISRYGDWYDSVVIAYQWVDAAGISHAQWDSVGAPGTKTLLVEKAVPFPGYGAAAALLKRSQGRGRVLGLEAVSDYRTTPAQAMTVLLPATPAQNVGVSAVTWSLPADEMTVTTKAATDLVKEAWLYLAAGVKWTDSAVGASWVSEPI